jgi:low temperature requirement protein LtrA
VTALVQEQRVTPLELFFDLVFVFAITQVTGFLAKDPSWAGLGRGLLILAALWWGWAAYAWLTNEVSGDDGRARVVVFVAMAAMILVSLAVPGAFTDDALLFALAYLVMRIAHLGLFWVAGREHPGVDAAVARLIPTATVGPLLLIAAAVVGSPAQELLWVLALAIDYGGPAVRGVEGYEVHPAHFAERFGLIVIIALGESIVAIGVGAEDVTIDLAVGVAAVLGIVAAFALWWAYFDAAASDAEHRLARASGGARARLARDSYAYLHLPLIAGVVLLALGLKSTLAHVDEPLETIPAVGLCGGAALYLLAHVAFRWRAAHEPAPERLVAAGLCLACLPLALVLDALPALGLVTAVLAALIAFEAIRAHRPAATASP